MIKIFTLNLSLLFTLSILACPKDLLKKSDEVEQAALQRILETYPVINKRSKIGKTYAENLKLAYEEAWNSIDPSTKVGAVLVDSEGKLVSRSHNHLIPGTPEHIIHTSDKYDYVIHAEVSTINKANGKQGEAMFITLPPCKPCADEVRKAGVKKIILYMPTIKKFHWGMTNLEATLAEISDDGMEVIIFDGKLNARTPSLINKEKWQP